MSKAALQNQENRPPRVYKVLLMLLPAGVVVGTVVFMFMYFYLERKEEARNTVIVSHGLRLSDLEDMVAKFIDRIGERDTASEAGRPGLRSAASMIEGRLGPQNVGYTVSKCEGEAAHGLLWKSLSVDVPGRTRPGEVVFAAVSYAGPGGVADANTVSTLVMLASSMASEQPARTIRFVFLPFDRPPGEQNRWLLRRCLKQGETCAGIIGLQTMAAPPGTGQTPWQTTFGGPADLDWWARLSKDEPAGEFELGRVPSVWLSHPVFSADTWRDKRAERLQRSMEPAQQLRRWLLRAAG